MVIWMYGRMLIPVCPGALNFFFFQKEELKTCVKLSSRLLHCFDSLLADRKLIRCSCPGARSITRALSPDSSDHWRGRERKKVMLFTSIVLERHALEFHSNTADLTLLITGTRGHRHTALVFSCMVWTLSSPGFWRAPPFFKLLCKIVPSLYKCCDRTEGEIILPRISLCICPGLNTQARLEKWARRNGRRKEKKQATLEATTTID